MVEDDGAHGATSFDFAAATEAGRRHLEDPKRFQYVIDVVRAQCGQTWGVATVPRALRDAGMRLDDATIVDALARSVGEEWKP